MPATSIRGHNVIGGPPAGGEGGGLAEPLLPREETTSDASEVDDSSEKEENTNYVTWPVAAAALLTIGGLVASGVAMISAPAGAIAVYVAGAVCMLNSASVVVKEGVIVRQVNTQGGLRQAINNLKDQANSLRGEVDELGENVDDLKEVVDTMKEAAVALDIIALEQGSNCDEIILLVRENEEIIKKQKSYLREVAIADITQIILETHKDGSMTIDLKEANKLTFHIQLQLNSHGIHLDQDQFKAIIIKDNNITNVLKVVGTIMFGETIKGRRMSEYAKEARREQEGLGMAAGRDALLASLALSEYKEEGVVTAREVLKASPVLSDAVGRFQKIAEFAEGDDEFAEEDEIPMFLMNENFYRESVSVAHGKRVSLTKSTKRSKSRRLLDRCKRVSHRLD